MYAKPGAMGLETAAGAALAGLNGNVDALVQALSVGPASILDMEAKIAPDSIADVVVFDAENNHEIVGPFRSKGCNEPMMGRTVPLKVYMTIRDGCIIYGPQNR